jgi:hypothetical protein
MNLGKTYLPYTFVTILYYLSCCVVLSSSVPAFIAPPYAKLPVSSNIWVYALSIYTTLSFTLSFFTICAGLIGNGNRASLAVSR